MKDEGFTLVEVVVALVILVLIGGIVMSSFNAILSVRTRARTNTLVPTSAPPSTPSITGMATRGSMYPRLK